jgi:hypothetical protein
MIERVDEKSSQEKLATQQRIQALEREVAVLHDMVETLHKLMSSRGAWIRNYKRGGSPRSSGYRHWKEKWWFLAT